MERYFTLFWNLPFVFDSNEGNCVIFKIIICKIYLCVFFTAHLQADFSFETYNF